MAAKRFFMFTLIKNIKYKFLKLDINYQIKKILFLS